MKKIFVVLSILICLIGCNDGNTTDVKYKVGVIQLAKHDALDAATRGFEDVLKEEFGDDVFVDIKLASGDSATCNIIASSFVSEKYDLILGNATPALQSAANATDSIPILGTAVTEYGVALEIDLVNNKTKRNVSGTSDLAPLDEQAEMFLTLLPDVKTVGLLYCQSEKNSLYQVEKVAEYLNSKGIETKTYSFSTSSELDLTVSKACEEIDALYIPTDNTCADNGGVIANAANKNDIPIITGEKSTLISCDGLATLSIDYYELGKQTGKMAIKILKGEKQVGDMEIEFYKNPIKLYSEESAKKYNVTIPNDYKRIEDE